mgnify:CR=1 FL=1
MNDFFIRDASIIDVSFIVETIIEAEKSGTEIFTYKTIFGLSENEAKIYIKQMLEEEVNGCELSVSSFKLAVSNNKIIAATAAWVEGSEGLPSAILKGNLLNYILPKNCIDQAKGLSSVMHDVNIEHKNNTIQLGLVYVSKEFRRKGLVKILIDNHIKSLKQNYKHIDQIYVQVFGNNIAAIKAYKKVGFSIIQTKKSSKKEILNLLPFNEKILMKREI